MSNETLTVSIADVYGAEWWERNRAELNREWEWRFGLSLIDGEMYCIHSRQGIEPFKNIGVLISPRIILIRRKPKKPTLREVYRVDEVTIPQGWEWTGEWRSPVDGDTVCSSILFKPFTCEVDFNKHEHQFRLILRRVEPKVWFKAEKTSRIVNAGEIAWTHFGWQEFEEQSSTPHLCATRYEEYPPQQVVTAAMVEAVR